MTIFAESENYIITGESENAWLGFKEETGKKVLVGDFYGGLQAAAIASDESFCALAGCGLVIYYLAPPFREYVSGAQTAQWREFFRSFDDIMWIDAVELASGSTLILTVAEETGAVKYIFDLDTGSLKPC
jgi:hypothetical protein